MNIASDLQQLALGPLRSSGKPYTCEIVLASFERLKQALGPQDGVLRLKLQYLVAADAKAYLQIELKSALTLKCQRCLELFESPIAQELSLELTDPDALSREAISLEGDTINIHALIEDELLLSIPLIATHDSADCELPAEFQPEAAAQNPFAILKEIKSNA